MPLPSGPGDLGVHPPPGTIFKSEYCDKLDAGFTVVPAPYFGVQDQPGSNLSHKAEAAVLAWTLGEHSPLRPLGLTTDDTITKVDGAPLNCATVDTHAGYPIAYITYIRSSQGEFFERTRPINLKGFPPPWSSSMHNLDVINKYRAENGAPPLILDGALMDFAYSASEDLAKTHIAHRYNDDPTSTPIIPNAKGENQGPVNGMPIVGGPNGPDLNATIDKILAMMIEEADPRHRANILNSAYTRLGVGLFLDGQGNLYLTNDFTSALPHGPS